MVLTRLQKRRVDDSVKFQSSLQLAKRRRLKRCKSPSSLPVDAEITHQHGVEHSSSDALQPHSHFEEKLTLNPRDPENFGLIQERLPHADNPGSPEHIYSLVVQSILWNQTRGLSALPVLESILARYPSPALLAEARETDLQLLLQPIGLWRQRAKRLIQLGLIWIEKPPSANDRYVKKGYSGSTKEGRTKDTIGWEIAHLPGVGAYALDAFRIFARDGLRASEGLRDDKEEAEWRTVVPSDKDLRAYLKWKWARNGWDWDPTTGNRKKLSA